jgi:hypothetical protein
VKRKETIFAQEIVLVSLSSAMVASISAFINI